MSSTLKLALKAALVLVVLLAAVVGIMRGFFCDVVVVTHDGMAPTLLAGEEALMWRGVDQADIETGDILVCRHPTTAGAFVVGRVLAKSGMRVHTDRNILDVSGTRPQRDVLNADVRFATEGRTDNLVLSRDTLGNTTHLALWPSRFDVREVTVPAGHVYLLGDYRGSHARDSRSFGTVAASNCTGTLFLRWSTVPTRGTTVDHGFLDVL